MIIMTHMIKYLFIGSFLKEVKESLLRGSILNNLLEAGD